MTAITQRVAGGAIGATGGHADPVRVLVVDDSAVVRGVIGRAIDSAPDMCVATTATNGQDALDALRRTHVDVVLLDIEMPVMDGLTALPLITERFPDVRVIVTSSLTREGAAITMRALALGAVDFVYKPTAKSGGVRAVDAAAAEIVSRVRAIARPPVPASTRAGAPAADPGPEPASGLPVTVPAPRPITTSHPTGPGPQARVLAIAASTGGPNAIAAVVRALPRTLALPVLVTQHMPPLFTTLFAQRLAREGLLPCEEARDGEPIRPGRVYVAPGDFHLTVVQTAVEPVVRLTQDPPEHHCRPAADPMLRSLACVYGSGAVAVVLTGMGEDGGSGAAHVAAAGGRVVVQDAATSVVWGMPGSVIAAGVQCAVLPLDAIAAHLTSLCGPCA